MHPSGGSRGEGDPAPQGFSGTLITCFFSVFHSFLNNFLIRSIIGTLVTLPCPDDFAYWHPSHIAPSKYFALDPPLLHPVAACVPMKILPNLVASAAPKDPGIFSEFLMCGRHKI
jgi:hypothetical protein